MKHPLTHILLSIGAGLLCLNATCQVPRNAPPPRPRTYTGQALVRTRDRRWTLEQGDIIHDKFAPPDAAGRPRPKMLTVTTASSLWPKVSGVATVYYVNQNAGMTDPTDVAANANIQDAINTFNADFTGLIQWVQWNSTLSSYYVQIDLDAGDTSGECEAAEGFENAEPQHMTGSAACTVGTILHEMGHVIGLWHEFQRPDRDNYVAVSYNNVIKGSWGNFELQSQNAQIMGLYDYASLMQYPSYSFSRNGGPVIETIPAGMPLGSVDGVPVPSTVDYSAGDKEAIERLYGAPPTTVVVTSNPVGLQVEVDDAMITTPQAYTWALNSTHTLGVPSNVQTLTGDIEDSTTSATFYYTYGRWNDSTAQNHTITVLPGDGAIGFPASSPQVSTYSANFVQLVPYTSSVYPSASGTIGISPTPQSYPGASGQFLVARQQATLTANPAAGWSFYEFNNGPFWLPGGLGANPKTFYVPDTGNPVNTTAEFTNLPVYKIDVTPEAFSSNLYAYADGGFFYTPKNFSPYYDSTWTSGSSHTLSIDSLEYPYSINSRYAFSSWSDAGASSHTIASLPGGSTSYVATVSPQFAPATNFSAPPCGGGATLSPSSSDGYYPSGQSLTFTATPGSQWTFAGWTYDLTGNTSPANLTATDETLVFANFNITDAPLTLTSVSPASAIAGGSSFTLTLNGTGFSPNSVVGISNGTATTYPSVNDINANQITITVPAASIASPGSLQIYVENFPTGSNGCAVFGYQTFIVHASNLATSTVVSSSSNPSTYQSSVTFTAAITSAENNATGTVTFKSGASVLGAGTLNASGVASYSTSSLAIGSQSITAVYAGDSNNIASTSPALTQVVNGIAPALTTPAPGSTLTGSSVTFSWSTGSGAVSYQLVLGTTGYGSNNLYNVGHTTSTSATVTGLPTDGSRIYARLWYEIGNAWSYADSTYTAATVIVPPALTTPAPGSTLSGSSATFSWTAGTGITSYQLVLGTTGAGSNNIYNAGHTSLTSANVTGLPTNGARLYARLWYQASGAWSYADYNYTESSAPPVLSTPAPGSTLSGSSVTFSWTTGSGVTSYQLVLGSTGAGSNNLYNVGHTTATSASVTGLPTNGARIYARLWYQINGTWSYADYTYTESSAPPVLTTPTPGSTLAGSSVTFTWTPGTGVTSYQLVLGTTGYGSSNLYNVGHTTSTSGNVTGLPTNSATIYARLWYQINGAWSYTDYTYIAQ